MKKQTFKLLFATIAVSFFLNACGGATGGGGTGGANQGGNQGAGQNLAACNNFGGSVQDNANVTYACVDQAGAQYEMKFDGNGGFVWYFIT